MIIIMNKIKIYLLKWLLVDLHERRGFVITHLITIKDENGNVQTYVDKNPTSE